MAFVVGDWADGEIQSDIFKTQEEAVASIQDEIDSDTLEVGQEVSIYELVLTGIVDVVPTAKVNLTVGKGRKK